LEFPNGQILAVRSGQLASKHLASAQFHICPKPMYPYLARPSSAGSQLRNCRNWFRVASNWRTRAARRYC